MIVWREKFKATGIHFLVTLALATCAAALVFLVWFPDPLQTLVGGTQLFVLVTTCDLVLGPLVSLIIYNSRKSRRALVFDYVVVGTVQITALLYGLNILAGTRPVYIAFSTDRLEIVGARDITEAELAAAKDPQYRSLPFTGPRYVSIKVPDGEHNEALFEELKGNEVHLRPRFYAPYESLLPQIRAHARTIAELEERHPSSKPLLQAASGKLEVTASRVAWLPVHHRNGFSTALIDTADGKPLAYVDFDPY
ncbi:MAG TPA: TfpX/TfpZ family type IV pilin accessory protein [Steroidobacteraceae bacterium]|nr:TfpX/TfpZ family type IV pilin accessory protein [Steroidobacteraceae bacterium]